LGQIKIAEQKKNPRRNGNVIQWMSTK